METTGNGKFSREGGVRKKGRRCWYEWWEGQGGGYSLIRVGCTIDLTSPPRFPIEKRGYVAKCRGME